VTLPIRIPSRYHYGMTIQIAVRLPDDIVAFVDEQVTSGAAPSRAAVVARALERERRREAADRDASIYAASAKPGDLDSLAAWAAAQPMDID
jgi:Arc/MetJ-type ribon-helix-helix transcriptional regulator